MITQAPRLYGRRKGRPLRARKARLMKELLPRLQIELPQDPVSGGAARLIDPVALFPFRPHGIRLEIGFGGGEHLAAQARQNLSTGFIGCEPFINGIAGLLDAIDKNGINNIRIFPNDARLLLDTVPDGAVERCFILFPDPWPKARHAERRFVSDGTCAQLACIMCPGATLRLASDDPGMIAWFRGTMNAAADFRCERDSLAPPDDWIPTRYEQKAIKAGRNPVYMDWIRC